VETVGIRFRSYLADDLDGMHALDVVCFEKPFRFSRGAMRRFSQAANALVTIAEDEDELVGFVILHIEDVEGERVGYIVTLDVSSEHRRRGIAARLMQKAERQALRDGCSTLVLHVFTGNEPAIHFYASHGFVRLHREKDFYGPKMDAWAFNKLLTSSSG
jgi:[ribosomal protein S18]-alanine N-acetyltransferase